VQCRTRQRGRFGYLELSHSAEELISEVPQQTWFSRDSSDPGAQFLHEFVRLGRRVAAATDQ
jgi:hypothetical protein